MRLLTIAWGDRYVEWFERACVASLALPKNIAALHEHVAIWDIATRPEDQPRLAKIADRLDLSFQFHDCAHTLDHGPALQGGLKDVMRRCLADSTALFLAPPDTIFGDGSVEHIINAASARDICIAVPHVRAHPKILQEPDFAKTNARLVALAWKHLHRTWRECDATRTHTNTFSGGTSWRKIGDGMYAVTHYLPTVYLAKFMENDLEWFEACKKCDAWDHAWPSKLVAEGRQRVIGSSDAAFMVELTPEFDNIPRVTLSDPDEPDKHWGYMAGAAHNVFARNVLSIFRAEA
jgi:hypothetical protein